MTNDHSSTPGRLAGRRVLVTGAGSGIGLAIAQRCAREGASVAFVGRTISKLEAAAKDIANSTTIKADVTDEAQVAAMVERAGAQLGGIDGVVNCAGFASMRKVTETTIEEWRALLDIHMSATFLVSRAAIPALRTERHASIVNVASVAGLLPGISGAAYAAAKGGQIVFSKALAVELAPAVRVNALCVGPTATALSTSNFEAMKRAATYADFLRLFPLARIAEPEEIAAVAAFLLSSEAAYVTGAAWSVDGGRSLH